MLAGKKAPYKRAVICVRFPEHFKRVMEQLAYNEGLDLSAWIRNILIKELKSHGVLSETFDARSIESGLEKLLEKTEQ